MISLPDLAEAKAAVKFLFIFVIAVVAIAAASAADSGKIQVFAQHSSAQHTFRQRSAVTVLLATCGFMLQQQRQQKVGKQSR